MQKYLTLHEFVEEVVNRLKNVVQQYGFVIFDYSTGILYQHHCVFLHFLNIEDPSNYVFIEIRVGTSFAYVYCIEYRFLNIEDIECVPVAVKFRNCRNLVCYCYEEFCKNVLTIECVEKLINIIKKYLSLFGKWKELETTCRTIEKREHEGFFIGKEDIQKLVNIYKDYINNKNVMKVLIWLILQFVRCT